MSHNISIVNGVAEFASRGTAWHGLGQVVENAMTSEEALKLAHIDWEVQKFPILANLGDPDQPIALDSLTGVAGNFATVRTDINRPLGVVGDKYTVVQNKDCFSFFDPIIDGDEAIWETAGAIRGGRVVFLTAKLPSHIHVPGAENDQIDTYVVLTNSHDGSGAMKGLITTVRVVCNNTLDMALRHNSNSVSIRHTTNAKDRILEAHKVLGIKDKFSENMNQLFADLARKRFNTAKVNEFVNNFIPMPVDALMEEKVRTINNVERSREALLASIEQGPGQNVLQGTGYWLFNGVTHYLDHVKGYRQMDARMLKLVNGGATVRDRAAAMILSN